MYIALFLIPWILIGIGVLFIGFSGGPGQARQAYLTRGSVAFKLSMFVIYLGVGIAVPAIILASRGNAEGATNKTRTVIPTSQVQKGKGLFRATCASCHTLAAINARGVTGPDLDRIGALNKARVLSAIKIGGTGQRRMPSGLLQGENAEDVAAFLQAVAGK
jgi:mono/diheme cytochrome c family protein